MTKQLSATLIDILRKRDMSVSTAESCSGGMIATAITDIPGASDVFNYGFVVYSNDAKTRVLCVPEDVLETFGAVSKETARAMIVGTLWASGADLAVVTTGIAGPGGGSKEKPVGLVYIGVGNSDMFDIRECHFDGDRDAVRHQTVAKALQMCHDFLQETE